MAEFRKRKRESESSPPGSGDVTLMSKRPRQTTDDVHKVLTPSETLPTEHSVQQSHPGGVCTVSSQDLTDVQCNVIIGSSEDPVELADVNQGTDKAVVTSPEKDSNNSKKISSAVQVAQGKGHNIHPAQSERDVVESSLVCVSDQTESTVDESYLHECDEEHSHSSSAHLELIDSEAKVYESKDADASIASLDTVDVEAAKALTFLKQSLSPFKDPAASRDQGNVGSKCRKKSGGRLYTGSIKRKGFVKSSLAKQHLQKCTLKKLVPLRSGCSDVDSDSQAESSVVSPKRMVIDLQPTRKSARQAAWEDKVKPWSSMMKRGKKTKLEKEFSKEDIKKMEEDKDGTRQAKKKDGKGKRKGKKGLLLDAEEVLLARTASDLLEKRLEENAAKNNLSVVNVKNILHHVITNEHVLAMVRNTMEDESADGKPNPSSPSTSEPVVFEPKMTRAKLKEVSEKSGKLPFVWPVSPVKKPKPQFTELSFSEDDDDDDDYRPSQEDLLRDESDYESTTSFGSPCPSTPHSVLNASFQETGIDEDNDETKEVEEASKTSPPPSPPCTPSASAPTMNSIKNNHIRAVPVPMGPPPPRPRPDRLKDDFKFLKELEEINIELEKSEDTIAHRTRSKFPIQTPLEEIEASFVAPDITEDMFETWEDCGEDNEEWVKWLAGLYHGPSVSDVPDDDQNDPEYNFLAEEEAVDEEDFRNDKNVQISKKEVNELLDGLIKAYEKEDWATELNLQHADRPPQPTLSDMIAAQRQTLTTKDIAKNKKVEQQQQQMQQQHTMVLTDNERAQLQQQVQQHVQLLAQIYLLSCGNASLEPHMNQAKLFLNELQVLATQSEATLLAGFQNTVYACSAFRPCNLAGALDLVAEEFTVTEKELTAMKANEAWRSSTEDGSKRRGQCQRSPPSEGAQKIIVHRKVFMYSELLPMCSLTDKPLEKIVFEKAEDILIVLGLMQFSAKLDRSVLCRMICQNMLPIKTSRQVMVHIKNACGKSNSTNVIKNWRRHGIKPILTAPCTPVLPENAKAPVDQYELYDKRPEWLKKYLPLFRQQRPTVSPVEPAPTGPTKPKEGVKSQKSGKTTPTPASSTTVSSLNTAHTPAASKKLSSKPQAPSFSKLEPLPVSTEIKSNGPLRIHNLFPKIAPKPVDGQQVVNQQDLNKICGRTTVQIITASGGALPQVLSQQTNSLAFISADSATSVNSASATSVNSASATSVNSASATSVNSASAPNVNPTPTITTNPTSATDVNPTSAADVNPTVNIKVNPDSVTTVIPAISPIVNPAVTTTVHPTATCINNLNSTAVKTVNPTSATSVNLTDATTLSPVATSIRTCATSVIANTSTASSLTSANSVVPTASSVSSSDVMSSSVSLGRISALQNFKVHQSAKANLTTDLETAHEKETTNHISSKEQNCEYTRAVSTVVVSSVDIEKRAVAEEEDPSNSRSSSNIEKPSVEDDENTRNDAARPPSRSKSTSPDSLPDDGVDDGENVSTSPGENILENADSNSQDALDADGLPVESSTTVEGDQLEDSKETKKDKTKMVAKRMKTKLRRDLESTVVLLDSDIVSKDPKREEREMLFSRAYLNKVKERLSSDPERYVDFLGIFNSFAHLPEIPAEELFQKICQALEGHADLIEDFTAFLPPEVALECGVLMESLEFAKARLFLRQVEVHFQKNPSQFQKVLGAIMEWGSKENKDNNELKESILPLLKGQPHLEQEFSLLCPDDRPPDSYMTDFEEIIWDDDRDKEYDSFEEIEIPDSDEETPIVKARVGRPPNKPPSGTQQGPSNPRSSSLHGLPKTTLLRGRLPSILKSPARKKAQAGLKGQVVDPWQELNTQLQYGTQGCKCSCHEKSPDTRVQRMVRHCAYCSITRKELISSIRGFSFGNKRRTHLITGTKQSGGSQGAARAKKGLGPSLLEMKAPKVHWASTDDVEPGLEEDEEQDDDEEGDESPYSDAVAHLSEMCDNLADYLNENVSEEDEEDKGTDVEDEDYGNEEEEDQYYEDGEELEEDNDDQEDKPEDDDDDDDDDDDVVVTSEESRGLDGATPESSNSPGASQGSQESRQSGGSNSGSSKCEHQASLASHTTLLGSGVLLDDGVSRANSPVMYSEDDRSTEDQMKQLKECLSQEKDGRRNSSDLDTVKNLICEETLSNSPIKTFSELGKSVMMVRVQEEIPKNGTREEVESSIESPRSVPDSSADSVAPVAVQEARSHLTAQRKPGQTTRRVKTVRPTHIPKVPFGQSERVPLFESLATYRSLPNESEKLPVSSSNLCKSPEAAIISRHQKTQSEIRPPNPVKTQETPSDTQATETGSCQQRTKAETEEPQKVTESEDDSAEKTEVIPLLSAANVARKKDGEVVIWTRDADRILLHQCRDQGATQKVFEEVAKQLGDKTSEQVADRFTTLMKLFQSATQNDEDDDTASEESEDETEDDSKTQDEVDNG